MECAPRDVAVLGEVNGPYRDVSRLGTSLPRGNPRERNRARPKSGEASRLARWAVNFPVPSQRSRDYNGGWRGGCPHTVVWGDCHRLEKDDTTRLLANLAVGDPTAAERLLPLVYDELRALAHAYFRGNGPVQTLQPTALVHEAYLKLAGKKGVEYRGRSHFMAVAATAMRQILVDRAREHESLKRGGGWARITLDQAAVLAADNEVDTLALHDVLQRLAEFDQRKARIAEMRFFGGLGLEQIAEVVGVARSTVAEDWRVARAWLAKELLDREGTP